MAPNSVPIPRTGCGTGSMRIFLKMIRKNLDAIRVRKIIFSRLAN